MSDFRVLFFASMTATLKRTFPGAVARPRVLRGVQRGSTCASTHVESAALHPPGGPRLGIGVRLGGLQCNGGVQ